MPFGLRVQSLTFRGIAGIPFGRLRAENRFANCRVARNQSEALLGLVPNLSGECCLVANRSSRCQLRCEGATALYIPAPKDCQCGHGLLFPMTPYCLPATQA